MNIKNNTVVFDKWWILLFQAVIGFLCMSQKKIISLPERQPELWHIPYGMLLASIQTVQLHSYIFVL